MKLKYIIKYVSALSMVIMVLTMLLIFLAFSQLIIPEMVSGLMLVESQPESLEPEPTLTEAEQRQRRIAKAEKKFLYDGSIHLVSKVSTQVSGKTRWEMRVRDVNDNLIWSGKEEDSPYKYLSWPRGNSMGRNLEFITRQTISPFFSDILAIPVVPSKGTITEYWQYEPSKRYFVGFDLERRTIGYAGSNGVKNSKNQIEPFEEIKSMSAWLSKDSYTPLFLWLTKNRLYRINFQERAVDVIFDAQGQEIDKIQMYNWRGVNLNRRYGNEDTTEYRPTINVRTKQGEQHLLLRDPNEQLTLKIPKTKKWDPDNVRITPTFNKIFLKHSCREGWPVPIYAQSRMKWLENYRYKSHKQWIELYQVDISGDIELISRFEWIYPASRKPKSQESIQQVSFYSRRHKMIYYLKTVSPPLYDLVWQWYYKNRVSLYPSGFKEINNTIIIWIINIEGVIGYFNGYYSHLHYSINRPLNWALSLLMVCVAFWHGWARRTSRVQFILWLLLVAAFNIAGLLTYLTLNYTKVIKCPFCGKSRGLNRVDCVRCGAKLPKPKRGKLDLIFNS